MTSIEHAHGCMFSFIAIIPEKSTAKGQRNTGKSNHTKPFGFKFRASPYSIYMYFLRITKKNKYRV